MKEWILAIAAAAALAFAAGGRIHPAAVPSGQLREIFTFRRQDALLPALYDSIMKSKPKAKSQVKRPGPGLPLRPKTAAPAAASAAGPSVPAGSPYQDAFRKMYDPAELEKWKNESIQQMQAQQNPFVVAAKYGQKDEKKS